MNAEQKQRALDTIRQFMLDLQQKSSDAWINLDGAVDVNIHDNKAYGYKPLLSAKNVERISISNNDLKELDITPLLKELSSLVLSINKCDIKDSKSKLQRLKEIYGHVKPIIALVAFIGGLLV
jgi:hypothetical protein